VEKGAATLSKRELIERLSLLEQTLRSEQERRAEEREVLAVLERRFAGLQKRHRELLEELELLKRRIFQAKSERRDTTQLDLMFEQTKASLEALEREQNDEPLAPIEPPPPPPKSKPRPTGRRDLEASDLPVERIEIADQEMESLVQEGKATVINFDERSSIRYRRASLVRLVVACKVYRFARSEPAARKEDSTHAGSENGQAKMTLVTATMPAAIIPRSIGTPSLFARILSAKFHMGLPLYRQEEIFAGERLPIDRGLMSKWCEELGAILGATIFHAARDEAMKTAFCLSTDATGVLVQPIRSHEKKQSCKKGNFFVVIADRDHVFFDYAARETSAHVMEMFRGYSGYIQADAKNVYDILYRQESEFEKSDPSPDGCARVEVGCWAHARRRFFDAATISKEPLAQEALFRIGRLYQSERKWKDLAPAQRREHRQRFSKVELQAFFAWAKPEFERRRDERGLLASALGYAIRQEPALMRFIEDGRLSIDNNHSERALRKVAIGRKNWLFVGSDDHAQTAANIFTAIASAKLHLIDPEDYLRDIFRVLPHWPKDRYLELAPKYWRATRAKLIKSELDAEVGPLTIPSA